MILGFIGLFFACNATAPVDVRYPVEPTAIEIEHLGEEAEQEITEAYHLSEGVIVVEIQDLRYREAEEPVVQLRWAIDKNADTSTLLGEALGLVSEADDGSLVLTAEVVTEEVPIQDDVQLHPLYPVEIRGTLTADGLSDGLIAFYIDAETEVGWLETLVEEVLATLLETLLEELLGTIFNLRDLGERVEIHF